MRRTITSGLLSLGILFGIYSDASYSNSLPTTNLPARTDFVDPRIDSANTSALEGATAQTQEVIELPEPEYTVVRRYRASASWYRHGRVTANGEKFDPNELTVAHRRLPFNTVVRFTNPETGQSLIARVNDRGPFHPNREFDLSLAAARSLSFVERGVIRLEVEILR